MKEGAGFGFGFGERHHHHDEDETPPTTGVSGTRAHQIVDAILAILQDVSGPTGLYKTIRRTPYRTLLPTDLPALTVFILREDFSADGGVNQGFIKFKNNITIGIAVARGFNEVGGLDGDIDTDADLIRRSLLTNAQFTKRYQWGGLFEGVPTMSRSQTWPQDAEAFMVELRLELVFTVRQWFFPIITDHLYEMDVDFKLGGRDSKTEGIRVLIDLPQEEPEDDDDGDEGTTGNS